MERTYSEQDITMMIAGLRMLVERDQSVKRLVDNSGKKQIEFFIIKKYKSLIYKLESEL